ncbi:MAG: 2-oxoacid:acceptor oxidoreductase family protein [Desulfobacteraceae bacterium]|nr:2-oxoacid:acceptor oxidoreductase family protein [Desulfobacteraceae bacterium]
MKQIKMYGVGGQGVVTAAKVLCEAVAIHENGYAQAIPAYGHERRGAPVYADAIISREPIKKKGFVYEPDYVVIFDDSVMDKGIDVMAGTSDQTVFIVNTYRTREDYPFIKHKLFWVDAHSIALNTLKVDIPNTAMLGAMAGADLVGIDAVGAAIKDKFGDKGTVNLEAARTACEQIASNA